jgi:hypothetical protein
LTDAFALIWARSAKLTSMVGVSPTMQPRKALITYELIAAAFLVERMHCIQSQAKRALERSSRGDREGGVYRSKTQLNSLCFMPQCKTPMSSAYKQEGDRNAL